jgi:hypothetical protein
LSGSDVNEPPVVGSIVVFGYENLPAGTELLDAMNVTDPDRGDKPSFSLVRVSSYPDDGSDYTTSFSVNSTNGAVRLQRAILDYESVQQYTMMLTIKDRVRACAIAISSSLRRAWCLNPCATCCTAIPPLFAAAPTIHRVRIWFN